MFGKPGQYGHAERRALERDLEERREDEIRQDIQRRINRVAERWGTRPAAGEWWLDKVFLQKTRQERGPEWRAMKLAELQERLDDCQSERDLQELLYPLERMEAYSREDFKDVPRMTARDLREAKERERATLVDVLDKRTFWTGEITGSLEHLAREYPEDPQIQELVRSALELRTLISGNEKASSRAAE